MGLYFFSGPVASIFGAFFSAAFQLVDGHAGLYGYQWLFLVFGLATVVAGAIIFIVLPSTPYDKGLLTVEEAQVQRHRMMRESQHLNSEVNEKFSLKALFRELADYKGTVFHSIVRAALTLSI
jgi:MFS family permease